MSRKLCLLMMLSMFALVGLSACDNGETNQSDSLDSYRSKDSATPAISATSKKSQAAQTGKSSAATVQPGKIYTFQGNVLLPPSAYIVSASQPPLQAAAATTGGLFDGLLDMLGLTMRSDATGAAETHDETIGGASVCGVASPNLSSKQKICFKFSQMYNRLYDKEHSGLDVWGTYKNARGNWYLLLTKSTSAKGRTELWVPQKLLGVYHAYADITQQKLLFLGDWEYQSPPAWPLQAYDAPGGNAIELKRENYPNLKSQSPMVQIVSVAQSAKQELWLQLNLINSLCETQAGVPALPVILNVWFPAYRLENNLRVPTVWYFAKGC